MRLGELLPFLFVILVLIAMVGAIGGAVYLVLRLRAGERISFPMRALFRVYLYVITLISLVTLVAGLSDLLQAGLGAALGKEFSYNPNFSSEPFRPPEPVKLADGTVETPPIDPKADEERRQEGLTRAMNEGILNGLSLAIVGGLILGLHAWGRRRMETNEERQGIFHRVYLILLLIIFGIITLVMLPSAVFEALRFYILDTRLQEYGSRPGESLATAIVALPVWVFYLRGAVSMLRKSNGNNAESAPAL